MTTQEAKDFLNRGYRSRERIQAKKERIASWREIAVSITAPLRGDGGVQHSPSKKVETCVSNIMDLETEIQDEIDELVNIERSISTALRRTPFDSTDREIMELRYLNYLTWEEIAVRMCMAYRWVMRRHKRALELFAAKWPC